MTSETRLTDAEIAELLALEAKATPGEWRQTQPWAGFAKLETADGQLVFHVANPSAQRGDAETSAEEKYANLAICTAARNSLRRALRELVERREAERKEWRIFKIERDAIIHEGSVPDEAQADRWMERFPNTWRKQYRIAAGPWTDAPVSEKENADERP